MKDTREVLISVGLRLLTSQGYAGTGLQQIVSEAGVPKGSFYNHFASKESYCAVVLERYVEVLLPGLESARGRGDPVGGIRDFHHGLVQILNARPGTFTCMLGALATEVDEALPTLRSAITQGLERWVTAYADLFVEAQQLGQVRGDIPARQLAEVFWYQWQGALAQMRVRRSTDSLELSLETMLSTLLAPPSRQQAAKPEEAR